jgi:hypothetical protein
MREMWPGRRALCQEDVPVLLQLRYNKEMFGCGQMSGGEINMFGKDLAVICAQEESTQLGAERDRIIKLLKQMCSPDRSCSDMLHSYRTFCMECFLERVLPGGEVQAVERPDAGELGSQTNRNGLVGTPMPDMSITCKCGVVFNLADAPWCEHEPRRTKLCPNGHCICHLLGDIEKWRLATDAEKKLGFELMLTEECGGVEESD